MMSNANGAMYGNIQGIKNLMKSYDKDGDYIDPTTGLAGLLVTEENEGSPEWRHNKTLRRVYKYVSQGTEK